MSLADMPKAIPAAIILPVLVPHIKSKYSHKFGCSPLLTKTSSKSVSIRAGIIPLIPPPSIQRILNFLFYSI